MKAEIATFDEMYEKLQHVNYIGDGIYAGWDGIHIVLVTSDGVEIDNVIYMEMHVFGSLQQYKRMLTHKLED